MVADEEKTMADKITAKKLRDVSKNFKGTAYLYELSEEITEFEFKATSKYVVSSGVNVCGDGPETLLFLANPDGTVIHSLDLNGSERGYIDPDRAMRNRFTLLEEEK